MNYFTATPIVKKIIQAYDFKMFIRVRLKAVYLSGIKNLFVKNFSTGTSMGITRQHNFGHRNKAYFFSFFFFLIFVRSSSPKPHHMEI